MILLLSEIKKILRRFLPQKIYVFVYSVYRILKTDKSGDSIKLNKQKYFTKKGVYDFFLEETAFKIVLDPDNGGVDSEIFSDGVYEPEILKIIKQNLRSDSVFLDIGANIGQHSLYASRFVENVYAFEPIKKLYDQFMESCHINQIDNIYIYNHALGNEEKILPIFGNSGNMGASSLVTTENRKKIQDIQIKRLDDIVSESGIKIIDFIKLDVEGFELDVLLGAQQTIEKYKPILLIEYSPYFYNQTDKSIGSKILNLLFDLGYDIFDVGDGTREKRLIKNVSDMDDILQTNILCTYEKN